jgi:hypothetical protein
MRFGDDQPKFSFRPSWKHLLRLVDLAVMVGLFLLGAHLFRTLVGEKKVAAAERQRVEIREEGARNQTQADSILAFEKARLGVTLADSVGQAQEFARRRAVLDATVAEQQRINEAINPLMDQVFDIQYSATTAVGEVRQYREDMAQRRATIADLEGQAEQARLELEEAQGRNQAVNERLAQARSLRARDPRGIFPDKSGVVVRQDIASTGALTNLAFQRSLWSNRLLDVGLSLGLGLSSDVTSSKEFGVILTRPLIHRRLGLDLGAGYTMLTDSDGTDETGAYASASLRLSPFFKERFHLGLGARAAQGADGEEVTPFVSVGVGRR